MLVHRKCIWCVPVTPLISTPIKHPLVKETAHDSLRFVVARDALPPLLLRVIAAHVMAMLFFFNEYSITI